MAFGALVGQKPQIDLSQYVTETELNSKGYATQSWVTGQNYATQSWVNGRGYATQSWVGQQGFATQGWVNGRGYATESYVDSRIDDSGWINLGNGTYQMVYVFTSSWNEIKIFNYPITASFVCAFCYGIGSEYAYSSNLFYSFGYKDSFRNTEFGSAGLVVFDGRSDPTTILRDNFILDASIGNTSIGLSRGSADQGVVYIYVS